MPEETNHNTAGEQAPSTVEKQAPSVSEEHSPSTASDQATDLPTANTPDPKAANPEANPNAAEPKAKKPAAAKAAADKPAGKGVADKAEGKAAAKKEKAPASEDKPFGDFIAQDYLPALKSALVKQGLKDIEVTLEQQKVPVAGMESEPACWQVIGRWQSAQRQFNIYFPKGDIQGQRAFSCSDRASKPSTLEPFLIDERKITLDLLVFGVVQRLNGQKWLTRN